ncbi:secretin N-terminal domain-containing protein [Glaciimonas sp. Gout2]|uniref:secretin N-terminal domain-containing protein n=2 Tax=Glaciimonas TaxID=1229970 RepID=UPI002AB49110|nr:MULTISPECIES: secretin N-terminal domain-containing protein [unclassified Glaciimonas]MDY7547918.1 secretin N-terminal domain-containing protein [Glaciimonas sp. CA11.2]MEB0010090.1 secretin N-terminal domain-containing protein [Glaciimonas sp. Cout2]MEB0081795.1 secretin N-terminal domain-containing protein [Glaciimonas sp. Gout2]
MQKTLIAILIVGLTGCASPASKRETYDLINTEMNSAVENNAKRTQQEAVFASLLPPLKIEMPKTRQPMEERFNLSFNNVPASQFFMALVAGTRYNMLVHPDVTGTISANLKNVTLFEALDAIRELYGYEYKVEGTRIYVKPLSLQTSIFQVNYLSGSRKGSSDIRVTSGSVSDVVSSNSGSNNTPGYQSQSGTTSRAVDSSKISTTSNNDFWGELKASLNAIIGDKDGRSVVISPQSGVVVIRAMSDELRNVSTFLKATQLSVDRQVILEAKIIEVSLNDNFQSGVNWSAFGGKGSRTSLGYVAPGTTLSSVAGTTLTNGGTNAINAVAGSTLGAVNTAAGSLFGLAFQNSNFAALISFLDSQGTVHVLSSPRIATMNNQKAVLKVGTDEFFVTKLTTSQGVSSGNTTTLPITTVDVQPFFSGVSLDVTPQIDAIGNITLHIHPSVSQVTTVDKVINLGASGGTLSLPLASSAISETDSVVRGQDGRIIAIGGLMRQSSSSDRAQVPGAADVPVLGNLFRNNSRVSQKSELVILLKPTIVQGEDSWDQDMLDSQRRLQGLVPRNMGDGDAQVQGQR